MTGNLSTHLWEQKFLFLIHLKRFFTVREEFIVTNFRSGQEIVNYGNMIMKGKGKAAKSFTPNGVGEVSYIDIHSVFNDLTFEERKT